MRRIQALNSRRLRCRSTAAFANCSPPASTTSPAITWKTTSGTSAALSLVPRMRSDTSAVRIVPARASRARAATSVRAYSAKAPVSDFTSSISPFWPSKTSSSCFSTKTR